MAFTADQETALLTMLAEWQASRDTQAQQLINQKQTAEGQLWALKPSLSVEIATAVDAELEG